MKENPEKQKELGVPIVAVDYSDVESVTKVLESHKVDTLISTVDSNVGSGPELVLIQAAEKSSVTKRYIPCLWGIENSERYVFHLIQYQGGHWLSRVTSYFPIAKTKLEILDAIAKTNLEWTGVQNGLFTDFYTAPKVKSYLNPLPLVLDIAGNAAGIPGTGDEPVVFTHTFDVAGYITELVLDTRKWEPVSVIVGDKITWNEFVKIAEDVKGQKFEVTSDSDDLLKQGKVSELPSHSHLYPFFPKEAMQGMFASFGRLFAAGEFDLKSNSSNSLNERYPDIKPRTVKELVQEAWGQEK
jgi:hypothetical protein